MHLLRPLLAALALACALLVAPATSHAAESYDNCAGTISSLPATITTQGVWCLKSDLSTNITSGNAITINTNNVTIDCNDFKLGGLAAGNGSVARGIYAINHQNITVRHCNVRGFYTGIDLDGGNGHLVEDNRLDNNLHHGIYVGGDNNLVQRNRVFDTGGATVQIDTYGIFAYADILDNTVAGGFAVGGPDTNAVGIYASGPGSEVRGNRVRGLVPSGSGSAYGIYVAADSVRVSDNQINATSATAGYGVLGSTYTVCTGNAVIHFTTAYLDCDASIDNVTLP